MRRIAVSRVLSLVGRVTKSARIGFVGSGFAAPLPSPPTLDDFKAAIVAYLDAAVQLRGYDSIQTATSYRDDPISDLYSTEGWAAFSFRSRVWTYANAELKKVE